MSRPLSENIALPRHDLTVKELRDALMDCRRDLLETKRALREAQGALRQAGAFALLTGRWPSVRTVRLEDRSLQYPDNDC